MMGWDDDGCCCEMDEIPGPCCHHHLQKMDAHTYFSHSPDFKGDASLVWPHLGLHPHLLAWDHSQDHGQDEDHDHGQEEDQDQGQSREYFEARAVRARPEARIILQIICNASITPVLRQ